MYKVDTKQWVVDQNADEFHPDVLQAAKALKEGKVIAFPTETVYGLGANALDTDAVKKIFMAKGRPSDNPLIVHIADLEQMDDLVESIDKQSRKLIDHFWPGPLTIILKRKKEISDLVTAGLDTVGIRMPNHPVALALIKAANLSIAAPSANRSGKPSPTTAQHVLHDLNGLIDGIVDGGPTGIGLESTVIDMSREVPTVLRPGGVTFEKLKQVLGHVQLDPGLIHYDLKPRAPGMKYTHYAPTGEMWIVSGSIEKRIDKMNSLIKQQKNQGIKTGVLTIEEHKDLFPHADLVLAYGSKENLLPFAEHLYHALRQFDLEKIDYILTEEIEEKDIGLAIMNRLRKAAGENIIHVDNLYS